MDEIGTLQCLPERCLMFGPKIRVLLLEEIGVWFCEKCGIGSGFSLYLRLW